MKRIYLGMALSDAPEWWTGKFQRQVRNELERLPEVVVSRFIGVDQTTPANRVYNYDLGLATGADLMVALTRFPSLGLGMEIQARANLGKATIIFHPAGMYLSKMPRGAPGVTVVHYEAESLSTKKQARQIGFLCKMLWSE